MTVTSLHGSTESVLFAAPAAVQTVFISQLDKTATLTHVCSRHFSSELPEAGSGMLQSSRCYFK